MTLNLKTLPAILTLTACGAAAAPTTTPAAPPAEQATTTSMTVQPVFFYVDGKGAPIAATTADSEPIQKVTPGGSPVAVLRPDHAAETWGDFKHATGTAVLACREGKTAVKLDARGLIPGGVYTAWAVFFEEPGFDPSFKHLTGMAPLGAQDGSDNMFTVGPNGDATLSVDVPAAGSVTVAMPGKTQPVPGCLLDTYELHLVLAYHLDGKTYGKTPGTPNVIAEQLAWPLSHGKPPHS